ncbi:hypothetical protein ACFY1U_21075 [Streptomyces sp. NPDC001351]|uniref:hypothetical protein n=1 Tax=Streptomyces sp. NPDC001351 TaxID=3364564 RepID=UPI0036B35EA8
MITTPRILLNGSNALHAVRVVLPCTRRRPGSELARPLRDPPGCGGGDQPVAVAP